MITLLLGDLLEGIYIITRIVDNQMAWIMKFTIDLVAD